VTAAKTRGLEEGNQVTAAKTRGLEEGNQVLQRRRDMMKVETCLPQQPFY
jgi:hypothetical protein